MTAGGNFLAEGIIQRCIFMENALSSLLFPNHLMYMDDIQLFARNERDQNTGSGNI